MVGYKWSTHNRGPPLGPGSLVWKISVGQAQEAGKDSGSGGTFDTPSPHPSTAAPPHAGTPSGVHTHLVAFLHARCTARDDWVLAPSEGEYVYLPYQAVCGMAYFPRHFDLGVDVGCYKGYREGSNSGSDRRVVFPPVCPLQDRSDHSDEPSHPPSLEITQAAVHRATGTSLGSICLGSGIVATVRVVGRAASELRRITSPKTNILPTSLSFLSRLTPFFSIVASVLDQMNGYALVYVGITGEAFWPSARKAVGLAGKRKGGHLLDCRF